MSLELAQRERAIANIIKRLHEIASRELIPDATWSWIYDRVRDVFMLADEIVTILTRTTELRSGLSKIFQALQEDRLRYIEAKQRLLEAVVERDRIKLMRALISFEIELSNFVTALKTVFIARERVAGREVETVITERGRTPVTEMKVEELSDDAKRLLAILMTRDEIYVSEVRRLFGRRADQVMDELVRMGYAEKIFDPLRSEDKLKLVR